MNADDWADAEGPKSGAEAKDALLVDVGGFEGPLDLLLSLAREQKVDLARISMLALAEQYLAFVERARHLSLELAADYLVMAAWLAYLKSRLLLPAPPVDEEPSAEELASVLAFRLRRLEAMRKAARVLGERNRLGEHFFARGMPEVISARKDVRFEAGLYDLLEAYAAHRQRKLVRYFRPAKRGVFSLQDARQRLARLTGTTLNWTPIDSFLVEFLADPEMRATARASALSASLEMVREGEIEIRQMAAFAPLYLRRRRPNLRLAEARGDG